MGLTTHLSQTGTQSFRLSGSSASGNSTSRSSTGGRSASGNSACPEIPERSSHISTHVGVSTYPNDALMYEHHTWYGLGTNIRADSGVFGASDATAWAPALLLGAYQGASQSVF